MAKQTSVPSLSRGLKWTQTPVMASTGIRRCDFSSGPRQSKLPHHSPSLHPRTGFSPSPGMTWKLMNTSRGSALQAFLLGSTSRTAHKISLIGSLEESIREDSGIVHLRQRRLAGTRSWLKRFHPMKDTLERLSLPFEEVRQEALSAVGGETIMRKLGIFCL